MTQGSIAAAERVYDVLKELEIEYESYEHRPVYTIEDCKEIDEKTGAEMLKNLFLTNRQQTEFYLLILKGDKKFVTKDVSSRLGVSRLSFGNAEKLYEMLSLKAGAVTPFGLINLKGSIRVIIDEDIKAVERAGFHPNTNEATVVVSYESLMKFLRSQKADVSFIRLD
ncbi:MAG: prolyl-tRNA synthetase associated domain-containing protein [Christensenellales bacterium]